MRRNSWPTLITTHNLQHMIIDKILDVITPYDCLSCGQEGHVVCDWCYPHAFPRLPDRCFSCKAVSRSSAVCSTCKKATVLQNVWAITAYDSVAKSLIRTMKIDCARQPCQIIARALHEEAPYLDVTTIVTAVPSSRSRVRERGFAHAEMIAKKFAHMRHLAYTQYVDRVGKQKQAGANRQQRLQQIAGAYEVDRPIAKGSNILLIDDVTTTGATLTEVAKILKKAGAKSVSAVVFAQSVT